MSKYIMPFSLFKLQTGYEEKQAQIKYKEYKKKKLDNGELNEKR